MQWPDLLRLVGAEPVFSSALLLAGPTSVPRVRLQLSRWVRAGRLLQLRRGVYALAQPWRKIDPHPFTVANALQRGSYVSLQAALSFHGVIPEHAPVVTSIGPGRPETISTALGGFQFNHMAAPLLYGYALIDVASGQRAFVASPEKALLDTIYLRKAIPFRDELEFALLDRERLDRMANDFPGPTRKLVQTIRLCLQGTGAKRN